METIIKDLINQYMSKLWLNFVVLVVTGFIMLLIKNFIENLVNYYKAKMSDLGRGAMIIWKNEIMMIKAIHFKNIEAYDDKKVIFIPIKSWLQSDKIYPKPEKKEFNENVK